MKKMILAASGAWLAGLALASAQTTTAPAPPQRAIIKVAGDVYRYQESAYFGLFMVTPAGVILVDPLNLNMSNWLKGEIARRFNGAKVAQVIYTHRDWDHAAGAGAFAGAKIISRVETIERLAPPAAGAKLHGRPAVLDVNNDNMLQGSEAEGSIHGGIYAGPGEIFSKVDRNGDGVATVSELYQYQYADVLLPTETYNTPVKKILLGGKTVELHHVKTNHASDLSFVYFPAEKILFFVDVISLKRLPFFTLPDFDEKDMAAIFDKALSFDVTYFIGGHGAMGDKNDIADYRQYHVDLQQGVQAGIDQGKTLEQIQAELTLDKYKAWDNYQAQRTMNILGMYSYLKRKK